MMETLKIIVVILQLSSILLLSVLLGTPARKHPIVNAIVVLALVHALFDLLPPLLYITKDAYAFNHISEHRALANFCIADSIVLVYLTTAKAAFALSFTIPCLYLAIKFTRARSNVEDPAPYFYRRTIFVLCVGPFVWGLPVLVIPLYRAVHNPLSLEPEIHGPTCTLSDCIPEIVALVLILLPLTVAILSSLLLIVILFKYYNLPDFRHSMELLHPMRIMRFVALIVTIMVSAILYAIVLASWVRVRSNEEKWGPTYEAWLITSSTWEAASPLIFFFIFAAQEEVLTVWHSWYRQIVPRRRPSKRSKPTGSTLVSPTILHHTCRRPSHVTSWLFGPCKRIEQRNVHTVIESRVEGVRKMSSLMVVDKYEVRPSDDKLRGRIVDDPCNLVDDCAIGVANWQKPGLTPAPRSLRSRSQSPRPMPAFRTMPSLTALGGKNSPERKSRTTPSDEQESDEGRITMIETGLRSQDSGWIGSDLEESIPPTAGSSHSFNATGTFGM